MLITNWSAWQTFRKDRGTPPWIKVYRNLLSNEQWVELTDSEKGQLVSMWLLAADKNGEIPDSPKMIQRMAMLDKQPNINKFIELGFLTTTCQPHDNQEINPCPQLDAPEESRVETEESKKIIAHDLDFTYLTMSESEVLEVSRIRKKNKGGVITQRVINGLAKEFCAARKLGLTNDQILTEWELRGWKSFKAEWIKSNFNKNEPSFDDSSTGWAAKLADRTF